MNAPKISFGSFSFEESRYVRDGKGWMASTLLKAVKEQEIELFEYPLACYDMTKMGFKIYNADDYVWHTKRVLASDYESYPIILDDFGQIADGYHRVCHALLDGKSSIMAYRLKYMPSIDFEDKDDENK